MPFNVPASSGYTTGAPGVRAVRGPRRTAGGAAGAGRGRPGVRVARAALYARLVPNASAPRPATVTAAAATTALPGAALTGYGAYQLVAGFLGSPMDRAMAATLGVIYLAMGLGVCWVARGLLRCEAWSRTPALMTYLLIGGVAYWMFQGGYDLAGALSVAYGAAGIVLLFSPGSHRVLTR